MKKWNCFIGLVLFAGVVEAEPIPVLDLRVDVAAWLESCSDSAATNEAYEAFTSLGISNMAVSVVVDETNIAAFVKIETAWPDARTVWLSHTNVVQLESVSENEFKWVPKDPDDEALQLFVDNLRVRFSGGTVLMAAENHFSFAEALSLEASEGSLLQGSVQLEPLLAPFFGAAEKIVDAEEDGFGKAIMSGMLESLKKATQSIQDLPTTSFAIMTPNPETRAMTLSLKYLTVEAAGGTKAFFDHSADAWKNPKVSTKQLSLMGLADTPFFQGMDLKGSELQFRYEWPSLEDSALLEVVVQATVGSLFSFTDTDSFPVEPEKIMEAPNLGTTDGLDVTQFGKKLRAALFFEHSWDSHVSLVVDYLDIPNADLLSATLTNISVLASNAVEVSRQDRPGNFRFDSTKKSAGISLYVEKDGPPAKTASFTIELDVPTMIEKYALTKKNPLMESNDKGCCLIAMSNSVVSLRSKGFSLKEAKVYALNAEGKYLERSGASWSASNYRGKYKGTPMAVKVIFPVRTESVTLDFKDIAVGKKDQFKMPKDPTSNVIKRYTMEPLKTYSDPDVEAIAASTMTFVTNAGWKKNGVQLQFPKPAGVETERIAMKSYLTGVDEWVSRGEGSGSASSGDHFYWDLKQTNTLNSASAVFGEVEGNFWSEVGTYSVNVSTNPAPLIPDCELPKAWVEHNVAWVEYEKKGKILDIQAFDRMGRRLKKDNRTSWMNTQKGYFFWGLPSRVTVVYASSQESIVVPFEIELKEGGLKAIPAVREKALNFEDLLVFTKEIGQNTRSRYGNLLSASYYASNSNKEPIAKIPLEVAQSDPVGVPVFGYDLTPCKGYYFRNIMTDRDAKKEVKKSSYAWAGGSFEATPASRFLLAVPVDKKNPAILIRWNDVYINYNDCSKLEQIPAQTSDLAAAGWIKVE